MSNPTGSSGRKLRVLAIIPSGFCFGLQNLTLDLFGELTDRIDAHFLNTRWSDGEFGKRVEALGYQQTGTWLGMFSRKLDRRNRRMTTEALHRLPRAWCDFLRLMRTFRPDIIYLANHHEVILLWPLLLLHRKRVVVHIHDPSPPILFQKASFFVWRRCVSKFVFISSSVRSRTALLGQLSSSDIVVHNGVRVAPLPPRRDRQHRFTEQFGWDRTCLLVGITGQMTETKGHEDFIDAAEQVATAHPELRFIIGGKPNEPFRSQLRECIAAAGLEDRFGWAGWLDSAQDFYESIDVLVLASRHDEGFGLVVAEAMERGCTVISTESGGATEIIENGISGLLVPKRNPERLANAINSVAENAELRHRLASQGRERVARHFDLKTQAARFLEALDIR